MTSDNRSRTPLILGFLIAGGALLGLGFCTRALQQGGEPERPALVLLAPAAGDTVADSLVIRFRTPAPLRLTRDGWVAGDLHPHVLLDGTEHMAAAADIEPAGDTFRWRLPMPAAGDHTLLLTWAASHHGTVGDTTGRTVRFTVR